MAYMPELHTCCECGMDLGPEDGDGICAGCDVDTDDKDWECRCSSYADGHDDDCPERTGRPR